MKVCELLERLKLENPLADVEIEIVDSEFSNITTFSSPIREVRWLGEYLNKVRLISERQGRVINREI